MWESVMGIFARYDKVILGVVFIASVAWTVVAIWRDGE